MWASFPAAFDFHVRMVYIVGEGLALPLVFVQHLTQEKRPNK